jgi:hypothetical protein
MTRLLRTALMRPFVALLVLVLAACGAGHMGNTKQRDSVLRGYASAVRWSEFDTAWGFVDPKFRTAHPLSDVERERYKQIEVTGYTIKEEILSPDELKMDRVIEIRLISRHTQVERVIVDRQHWEFDPVAKRWWLMSGLPDIEPR